MSAPAIPSHIPERLTGADEAPSYRHHVLEGLPWRNELPPELRDADAVEISWQQWQQWHDASFQLWEAYLARRRQCLGSAPLTGLPERSAQLVVMIEMRPHQDLEIVLRQSLSCLQRDWAVLIICGDANRQYVEKIIRTWSHIHLHCLKLVHFSREAYANYRRSQELLDLCEGLGAELVLFLECDAVLLKDVAQFVDYDLVGAPWSWNALVGNGGLTLRRVSFMRKALEYMAAQPNGCVSTRWWPRNEDMCFAEAARKLGAKVPTWKVAAQFSVETIFHPRPAGCHKPWQYLLPSDLTQLLESWELVD